MEQKTFNAFVCLLSSALGAKPEDIINWIQHMSQGFSPGNGNMAEYMSMVLAPFNPKIFILVDDKRKTFVVGGPGTVPKQQNYKVEFGPELTTIGKWFHLFSSYIGEDLVIPRSVISIDEGALEFMDYKRLSIETRLLELPHCICCGCRKLTDVRLPDTIEIIGHSAFRFCSNLADINIPASVHTIEALAFQDCTSLPEKTKAKILEIGGPEAFGEKGKEPAPQNN